MNMDLGKRNSTDAQSQGVKIMIKQNLAIVSTIGKMHLEDVLATESNMPPKLLPTRKTNKQRGFEGLCTHHKFRQNQQVDR